MSATKRKTYSPEFKRNAVNLLLEGKQKNSEIARDLGIHVNLLYKWRIEFESNEEEAFPGKGNLSDKDYEIRRLRIALSKAEEERDILKKAVKFFSQTG